MMQGQELHEAIEQIQYQLLTNQISIGQAAKALRKDVLKMRQADFAKRVGLSTRTLSAIESDAEHSSTLATLNQLFKLFGLKVGLIPSKIEPQKLIDKYHSSLSDPLR